MPNVDNTFAKHLATSGKTLSKKQHSLLFLSNNCYCWRTYTNIADTLTNKCGRSVVVNSKSQESTTRVRVWLITWCRHLWSCGRNFIKTQITVCWCANRIYSISINFSFLEYCTTIHCSQYATQRSRIFQENMHLQ